MLLIVAAASLLPVWPYSAGWGYYFSGFMLLAILALVIPPLFLKHNGEEKPKVSRTKAQPEFLDEVGMPNASKGQK